LLKKENKAYGNFLITRLNTSTTQTNFKMSLILHRCG